MMVQNVGPTSQKVHPDPERTTRRSGAQKAPNADIDCGPLGNSIRFFVLRANRILSQNWTSSALDQSMHLLYYFVFALIGTNPGVSLVELARFVVLDKSRASELIESMEQQHLIVR